MRAALFAAAAVAYLVARHALGAATADLIVAGVVAAIVALALLVWAFVPSRSLPANRVRSMRIRLRLRLYPGRGHATLFGLWLRWGRFAAFRRSGRARRSLPWWLRLSHPGTHSILVGLAHYRHRLRVLLEEHILVMSPPRKGKSGWLARVILHYPGAVVSTSTKHDVFELTSGVRALRGPVHVFNPQQIGGVPSTFRWDPLDGCQEPAVAIRRADAFATAVDQKGVEGGAWFGQRAAAYLRAMFCAAALDGRNMLAVATWAFGFEIAEAQEILQRHGHQQWALELGQLRGEARKTVETIQMTMTAALGFMTDPRLLECVLPGPGAGLDIGEFLFREGTLYLIAEAIGETAPVAPLFACLTSEVRYEAALIGSMRPGGRLDPPLLLALDEVTQICPVPVPSWLADSGGKGVQVITVAHGEAQLRGRWGDDGCRVIQDTSGVQVWLPGVTDPKTLDAAEKLCGTVAARERGDEKPGRHPVLTADMVRQIPDGYALVVRGNLPPVVPRLPMCWKDRTYRRARRAGMAVAPLTAAPALAAVVPDSVTAALPGPVPDWPQEPAAAGSGDAFPWGR